MRTSFYVYYVSRLFIDLWSQVPIQHASRPRYWETSFMYPFTSYVLRSYYKAIGWNEDNLYANLTSSSNAILDFNVPRGLHFSVSKSPNELFNTTYSMTAMPSLNGSVGYIFTSCPLDVKSSGAVRFKDVVERFKVFDQPRRPEPKGEEWLAGERVDKRDYLLYGRLYLPTGRLDALYAVRLSSTVQALVAAISDPPSATVPSAGPTANRPNLSNVMINLQHDVGKWCTEYTWSADDGMFGVRALHNFGKLWTGSDAQDKDALGAHAGVTRVDEEEAVEDGLKGRFSAGAELYFSAKERSAGVSTGVRFTTLPETSPSSSPSQNTPLSSHLNGRFVPSQPPTTITALFNPMLGHLSGAYTARVSRDLAMSSRFDFNIYSYESEWTLGAEWWLRHPDSRDSSNTDLGGGGHPRDIPKKEAEKVHGVVKARASTTNNVSVMWEGRLRNMLVSLGVVSNFTNRSKPISAIGLEVSYFSSS